VTLRKVRYGRGGGVGSGTIAEHSETLLRVVSSTLQLVSVYSFMVPEQVVADGRVHSQSEHVRVSSTPVK
jgi:hypothetical protein